MGKIELQTRYLEYLESGYLDIMRRFNTSRFNHNIDIIHVINIYMELRKLSFNDCLLVQNIMLNTHSVVV